MKLLEKQVVKLKELIAKDDFFHKLKKLPKGTKVQFYGQTPKHLDVWKTFYFQEVWDTAAGKKVVLSLTKIPKVRMGKTNRYVYTLGKITPINPSGARPNAYTMTTISDIKMG
jgi:hypothetical protein